MIYFIMSHNGSAIPFLLYVGQTDAPSEASHADDMPEVWRGGDTLHQGCAPSLSPLVHVISTRVFV